MTGRMLQIPADTLETMFAREVAKTDESLQAEFGISYNTWRRIEAGEPIRASVAQRLVSRVSTGRPANEAAFRSR